MRVFRSLEEVPHGFGPSAIAIGKFDGVHLGHRALIETLCERARELGIAPVVVTFDRNPLALLRPERCPPALVSNAQKLELLAEAGVEATLMLTFDEELSAVPATEFAENTLVRALRARLVLAGADFRFGARGQGDVELLTRIGAERGFETVVIGDVAGSGDSVTGSDRRASSTWIRELLDEGKVHDAARLLGRPPTLRSVVVHGEHRGRELGFPTANLDPDIEGFVPQDGVYAAWATIDGQRYAAAVSIGNNPTFEGIPAHQVEAFLLDAELDAYGRTIELEFIDFVRPMLRFDGIESLIAGLTADVEKVREILGTPAPR
ncbi:bifunctional riboflavin kinase/FAD synthetase [uncultured Schumannella sp.]|uniref:bifunctional riboflavin kinase/FAD synthetase n=1 Tax=uncultured Schumannella sp. TaxID=1195956 RepID=UPI0025E79A8C|nr:bifunctional riboflavin kinase/FAD synthetase [uncultured Schumannella sp.]